jgi:periplasmic protein TonB
VASPTNNRADAPGRAGYLVAILVSALGHVGLFVVVFFLAPRWLHSEDRTPPAYTVKIVDALPAGDLGSHLPRLAGRTTEVKPPEAPKEEPPVEERKPPEQKPPADEDKNAIALNTKSQEATPTETPTPTPEPTPVPTVEATKAPSALHTALPRKHPIPVPTTAKRRPNANPTPILMAKAEVKPTPSVQQRLNKLRAQLLAESLKRRSKDQEDEDTDDEDEDTDTPSPPTSGPAGAGPVVGSIPREGKGYGVGSGTGSEGMLQDPDFVLYYQAVQDKIKKAWSFMGGSSDLTATVDFSIGPDGALTGVKLAAGSKDSAFDESVIRAIRRAAPFPAPPDKYRSEFMQGIEAQFALGDLRS